VSNNVYINHPWHSSFGFNSPYSDARLEQIHKLTRNLVAALDMGCPNVRHAPNWPGRTRGMSPREVYKLWVSDWRTIYKNLSNLIAEMKRFRKTVRFPELTEVQKQRVAAANPGANASPEALLRGLSDRHLWRLQETAQVMLNARYNAKLAAAEARRREREALAAEEVKQAA
jgi:hypothetical protein